MAGGFLVLLTWQGEKLLADFWPIFCRSTIGDALIKTCAFFIFVNLIKICAAGIKQKRGYKDQWPWSIKLYIGEQGKNKGCAVLSYEDPSAAHSAGGFFNSKSLCLE